MRDRVKNVLAMAPQGVPTGGVTVLIYHRIGGGTGDELDLAADAFVRQLDMLADGRVLSLDDALDRLDSGDSTPAVVLTFDDGFDEVFHHAWPHLRDRGIPFLVYLATAYMGAPMRWPGATAAGVPGTGLTWAQLEEMTSSGLCSVGNHTHTHARPEALTTDDLDACTETIEHHLGIRPAHFTYPWGVPVPALEPALRQRFRSASTGEIWAATFQPPTGCGCVASRSAGRTLTGSSAQSSAATCARSGRMHAWSQRRSRWGCMPDLPILTGPGGRSLRVGHLTTVDLSLAKLLETELRVDVAAGLETFGLSAPGPYVASGGSSGVRHVPIPSLTRSWQPARDAAAAREIAAALRHLKLDVLHTHNPKTGVLGRLIGRTLGVPVVVNTCHGLWAQPTDRLRRRALVLTAEAVAAQASHAELYQNGEDQAALARYVPSARSRLVGNGTDLTAFRPDPGPAQYRAGRAWTAGRRARRRRRGTPRRREGHPRVRVDGPSTWQTRHVPVGRAGRSRQAGCGQRLDRRRALRRRTRRHAGGLQRVRHLRRCPRIARVSRDPEWKPLHRGLPLVLSDIRGCREIGDHGRQVLLVPPRDAEALTAAVAGLIDDVEFRNRLARAAHARALEHFDQVAVAAASLDTYAEVARRRSLGWTVQRRSLEAIAHG